MSRERAKYELPIEGIAHHRRADAPAGIFILEGRWHLAAHDSVEEVLLLERGALLIATLTFTSPARPADVAPIGPISYLRSVQLVSS